MGERALETFEAITAVNEVVIPREALPTDAIEPVVEIQHEEPSTATLARADQIASVSALNARIHAERVSTTSDDAARDTTADDHASADQTGANMSSISDAIVSHIEARASAATAYDENTEQLDASSVHDGAMAEQLDASSAVDNEPMAEQLDASAAVDNEPIAEQLDASSVHDGSMAEQLDASSVHDSSMAEQLDASSVVDNGPVAEQLDASSVHDSSMAEQLDAISAVDNGPVAEQVDASEPASDEPTSEQSFAASVPHADRDADARVTATGQAVTGVDHDPSTRLTERMPELCDMRTDTVADQRGLHAIGETYARERVGVARGWLYAAGAVSIVSVVVSATVVVWARGQVREAQAANQAVQPALLASTTSTPPTVAAAPPAAAADTSAAGPEVAAGGPEDGPDAALDAAAAGGTTEAGASGAATTAGAMPPAGTCSLRVTANVRGASIYVDGEPSGVAPADVPVACGREAFVELRRPRYQLFKRTITVDEGSAALEAQLERDKTELTVWSQPQGATVTYNGRVIGKTPLVTRINRYEAGTLWFRAPGMAADYRKIVPREARKTVSISLKPRS